MRDPQHIGHLAEKAFLDCAMAVVRYNAPRIATRDPELSDAHMRATFAAVRHIHATAARLLDEGSDG